MRFEESDVRAENKCGCGDGVCRGPELVPLAQRISLEQGEKNASGVAG